MQKIAEKVGVSLQTVKSVKKVFHDHQGQVEKVVTRKTREMGPREIKMTGNVEARLIALCCSPVPEGYARWTVRLLADKMVELNYIDEISPMTVSRTLSSERNSRQKGIDWQFRTTDARIKLKRLYPVIKE